ncbi:putative acyl-protein synthetase [Actinoplanes missouriensis 431]|uniref:Putative acyl-protein synthetase n=1 Tax=Actinoplanes missouriensis (strain ATCC 14538 / DSM 43046 / CBS 188.64 / JCM 3121 / NBRC 102363 / NCIMB 12654 / NRRL B-3342 / UNCC 431) TaxID=512565 RepID=I0GY08_ACTM4|nr:acyl-protein synthetase [Actinoplanes missouriensis]BAL85645.1 putative acyl-protein synthetase [Actinoplanes missouriensis 431]
MSVFTLSQSEKESVLLKELSALTEHHRERCEPYARILDASGFVAASAVSELPYLPVRLFKNLELKSIPDDEVFKVLTSSGTTGEVSRIYLDKAAAAEQQRRLAATVQTVLGPKRLPMLLVDTKAMLKDRRSFSARGAGVLGMSTFGRDHVWALDNDGAVDLDAIRGFLEKHGGQPFLIFGFTYLVWLHLYEVARDNGLDLGNGILIHSGGWKKLIDQAVSPSAFREALAGVGLTDVHNYYGMVEQIGTIFLEGPSGGSLYCPDFADVVVRDPETWAELPPGKPGLLEVVSTLPTSYPGHVLLTEDLGVVHGIDDGDWPGKRFSVLGRLPRAEARGCSDTYRSAA